MLGSYPRARHPTKQQKPSYNHTNQPPPPNRVACAADAAMAGSAVLNDAFALAELHRLAAAADVKALAYLADVYFDGRLGAAQDRARAVELFLRAGEQGDVQSLFAASKSFLHGVGVAKDLSRAVALLKQAAYSGQHAEAMCHLANAYTTGQGVQVDREMARGLYQMAADRGCTEALYHLASMCEAGNERSSAVDFLQQAAAQGHEDAQRRLADMLSSRPSQPKAGKLHEAVDIRFSLGTLAVPVADPPHEAKQRDPVWDAAYLGNTKELRSLLSRDSEQPGGSSLPVPSELGHHLSIACARGHAECASLLLTFGAPVDWTIAPRDATPLMIAAQMGNLRMVKLLVEHGADFELKRSPPSMGRGDDWTAWKLASFCNDDDACSAESSMHCRQDRGRVDPASVREILTDDVLLETHPWACDLPSFVKARRVTAGYLHALMMARADQAMMELLFEEDGPSRAVTKKGGKKKKPAAPGLPVDQAAATEPAAAHQGLSKSAMRKARRKKAAACDPVTAVHVDEASASNVDQTEVAPTAKEVVAAEEVAAAVEVLAGEEVAAALQAQAAEEVVAAPTVVEEMMATPTPTPDPPDDFVCPITQALMDDPVLATDGHTYERRAIEAWLARRLTSPRTGGELQAPTVFPNHSMRRMIIEWREAHGVGNALSG